MAQGWSHGPAGAVVAAWPAVSLVGSYELLVWLTRAPEDQPPADQPCEDTVCHVAARSALAAAIDGEQHSRNDRDHSAQGWQPATPASGQHGDGVLGADAGNDAAVAAYWLSVRAGNPLSERRLAQMFGRTSRRWARARIADARRSP